MGLVLDGAPRAIIETPYLTSETRIALIAAYGAAVMHYERGIIAVDLLDRTAIIGCARDGMWVTIGNTHNPTGQPLSESPFYRISTRIRQQTRGRSARSVPTDQPHLGKVHSTSDGPL